MNKKVAAGYKESIKSQVRVRSSDAVHFGGLRPVLLPPKVNSMSDNVVPHFHNDAGVPVIEIGSQEFMCVGANPPFDHPHVFLDLGNDNEIICPYCSTLYRFAPDLGAGEARPPECVLRDVA